MQHVPLPLPNIFDRDFSWYGRMRVMGFSAMSRSGFRVSLRKSYSSKVGYPKLPGKHRCLTCSTRSGRISKLEISRCGSYSGTPVASNVEGTDCLSVAPALVTPCNGWFGPP